MAVGDLNSNEPGSGARFNDGKPAFDLIPIRYLYDMYIFDPPDWNKLDEQYWALEILNNVADFQETGNPHYIKEALGNSTCHEDEIQIHDFVPAANVFSYGKEKYAAWNWTKGMNWSVPLACIVRHLDKILRGESIDDESGLPHMGHVQCNLFMLLHYTKFYNAGNDLPDPNLFKIIESSSPYVVKSDPNTSFVDRCSYSND